MAEQGIRIEAALNALGVSAEVPIGVSAAILIGGRNDMLTSQKLGAWWEVRDPDGVLVDSYFDWATFSTPAGQEHGFVGNQFLIDKPGNWTIEVRLMMNVADPVVADSYDGLLCVVSEVYAGSIVRKELDYDGVRVPFP